jgi:hypothetical protein
MRRAIGDCRGLLVIAALLAINAASSVPVAAPNAIVEHRGLSARDWRPRHPRVLLRLDGRLFVPADFAGDRPRRGLVRTTRRASGDGRTGADGSRWIISS